MIDFDNPKTFPKKLKNWGTEFEKMVLRRVNTANIEEWWQIEHLLQDIRIGESQLVTDFVKENMDTEIAVCHCTRILDENEYWKHGLVTAGGENNAGEKRLRKLLVDIGLDDDKIEEVFSLRIICGIEINNPEQSRYISLLIKVKYIRTIN